MEIMWETIRYGRTYVIFGSKTVEVMAIEDLLLQSHAAAEQTRQVGGPGGIRVGDPRAEGPPETLPLPFFGRAPLRKSTGNRVSL